MMASKRARQTAERTTQLFREWLEDAPSKWFKKRPAVDHVTDEEAVEAIAWALSALALGIPLTTVAALTDTPPNRISQVERNPTMARPGEIERLRKAIDEIAGLRPLSGDAA